MRRVYDYAKSKGYVLPTVFQGNYNPVARHYDTTLFPLLRELNIAFYAYSPIAGGFLVKDAQTLNTGGGQGRWDPNTYSGKVYNDRYTKPSLLEALSEWEAIANEARVSKAALAYRWVMYNSKLSHGDGIIVRIFRTHIFRPKPNLGSRDIACRVHTPETCLEAQAFLFKMYADPEICMQIGASRGSQLEETLRAIKDGPLDEGIAKRVDEIWKLVKDEAPIDNYHL